MPRRSTRRAQDMRARLVDAAEACLSAGSGDLTARDVMAAAGVSTGTLYHYFDSLDELLLAVAERAAATQAQRFGPPGKSADPLGVVLQRLFAADRRDTILPSLRQRAIHEEGLRVGITRYDTEVATWLEHVARELVSAGHARADVDIGAAVEIVRALAEGFQLRVASGTLSVPADRFVAALLDVIERGWLNPEPAPPPATSSVSARRR